MAEGGIAMTKATLTGKAIVIEHPDSPGKLLLVEIDVNCPDCGQYSIGLVGHHLKAIRDLLVDFIDLHPDLTGSDAGVEVLQRYGFSGRPTQRPENN